jgi:hypothetical protein
MHGGREGRTDGRTGGRDEMGGRRNGSKAIMGGDADMDGISMEVVVEGEGVGQKEEDREERYSQESTERHSLTHPNERTQQQSK